jgi:GT2 family glycosyltransferase
MDLSIIIVNWNSKMYLRKCLSSILENTQGIEYEIVVIDGGSYDGCGEMLTQIYPHVKFIQSDENRGFAKANNEAFKASEGRNILFLNPDTEIKAEAVRRLSDHLDSIPNAGVVGAKLLNSDGTIQTTCVRVFPTIVNQIMESEALRRRLPHSSLWGIAPLFDNPINPVAVDAVSGACLMIRRSLFEKVDKFSTDYFMYSEDIDLCYKVQKAGWKTYYVPTALIVHHGGGSSSRHNISTFSSIMMMESRWRFFQKTRFNEYGIFYRLAVFISAIVRTGTMLVISPIAMMQGKTSSIKPRLEKWIAVGRWAIGLEKWVKNY